MNENVKSVLDKITNTDSAPSVVQIGFTKKRFCYKNGFVVLSCSNLVLTTAFTAVESTENVRIEMCRENMGILIYGDEVKA